MNPFETIKDKLDADGIPYQLTTHEPVHTSEQAAVVRSRIFSRSEQECMRRGAKAMIIRSEGRFFQFVLPGNAKLDFRRIKEILQTESASLATAEEVGRVAGCEPGAVPPFGTLFGLPTYVDESLLQNGEIDFNAGKHTISITMKTADWNRAVKPDVASFVQKA